MKPHLTFVVKTNLLRNSYRSRFYARCIYCVAKAGPYNTKETARSMSYEMNNQECYDAV